MKLEEEQSKRWVADEDVLNCMKCNIAFGWTMRKVWYLIFYFFIKSVFHSIIVDIVKRFFVVIVQIIGYKVKKQSIFRINFPKKKTKIFFCFSSPQYRICDYCNEKELRQSLMPNDTIHSVVSNNHDTADEVDLHFEVRPERLHPTTDT